MLDELEDLLARLAGTLKDSDLEDPQIVALLVQLSSILEVKPTPLPHLMVLELSQIRDKVERFKQAAQKLQAINPDQLKQLSESLKVSGLLK